MTRLKRVAEQLNYNSEGRAICPDCGSELTIWIPNIRNQDKSCTPEHWHCEDCCNSFGYTNLNVESNLNNSQ